MAQPSEPVTVGAEYLTLKALSVYAGLSLRTLRGYLHHPTTPLPHYRIGGCVRVRRSEFDTWAAPFRVVVNTDAIGQTVDAVLTGLRG